MKKYNEVENLNGDDENEFDAFQEVKGEVLGSFNFEDESQNNINSNEPLLTEKLDETKDNILIDQRLSNNMRGQTPDIDGEKFTVKRGYVFRESTLRKLMVLKANHEDINIYMNTIIDVAINHYYDFVMNQSEKQ